jgi:hypothetical protein
LFYDTVIVAAVPEKLAVSVPLSVTTVMAAAAVGVEPALNVAVSPLTVKYGVSPTFDIPVT